MEEIFVGFRFVTGVRKKGKKLFVYIMHEYV